VWGRDDGAATPAYEIVPQASGFRRR